jgi:hypothetical protein
VNEKNTDANELKVNTFNQSLLQSAAVSTRDHVRDIRVKEFSNAPLIESVIRIAYNVPILGIPVEKGYRWANAIAQRIDTNPKTKWWKGFAFAVLGIRKADGTASGSSGCKSCHR